MSDDKNPIPRVTRDDPAAHSGDVVAENIATLKALFPAIVTDGKVDFDVLRQLLGDAVDDGAERYVLNWKGKSRARAFALTPSLGTLRPAKADSVDWDTTKNIVIEGDNLEVLKLLRKWLETGVMEDGTVSPTVAGTPQGGVISPLLSNIYLHVLDTLWTRNGAQYGTLVRYADDFVVICRTRKDAERAEQRVREILTRLGLELS